MFNEADGLPGVNSPVIQNALGHEDMMTSLSSFRVQNFSNFYSLTYCYYGNQCHLALASSVIERYSDVLGARIRHNKTVLRT